MALSLTLLACSSSNNEAVTPDVVADTPAPDVIADTPAPAPDTKTPVTMKDDDKVVPVIPVDPSIPVLTLSFTPTKAFRFTWAEVPGATSYNIKEAITVASGFDITPIVNTTDIATRSFDYVVPLYARLNAKYILQSCNAAGKCAMSAEVHTSTRLTDMADSIGYFKASNTDANDYFGHRVSLSADGNTLAVSAWGEASNSKVINTGQDDDTANGAGAVYVFTRNNASAAWLQQAYLKAKNAGGGDRFGKSVSLSANGHTLAVGAEQEDGGSGAAYVFIRSGITWAQQAYLKAENAGAGDQFGINVSLSADGSVLAVSAPHEDSNAATSNAATISGDNSSARNSGAVYVFARTDVNGTITWPHQAHLKASNVDTGDKFGSAISLSADGNTLAVGVRDEGSNETGVGGTGGNDDAATSGAVYVFARTSRSAAWSEQAYLKASNAESADEFGYSVSLNADGNTLAVSAWAEDSNAKGVGGDKTNDLASQNSGAAYVFIRNVTGWSEQAYLKASNTQKNDYFGYSVSISANGNTLAVSTYHEDSNTTGIATGIGDGSNDESSASGAVYTFTRSVTIWSAQAYLKASNTGAGDSFGYSMALSGDGGTLAVAASSENSNAKGVNADQDNDGATNSGAVYVY